MTLEQIWAALPEGAKLNARALALAVLDRAENSGCIYPYCEHPCADCPLSALRTEIERLGTDDHP